MGVAAAAIEQDELAQPLGLREEVEERIIANSARLLHRAYQRSLGEVEAGLLSGAEWAEAHHVLPSGSAHEGRWDGSRAPYLREVLDVLGDNDPRHQVVVVMKAAQIGFTEIGAATVLRCIHQDPAPISYYFDTESKARSFLEERIIPAISREPLVGVLPPRAKAKDELRYAGGVLRLFGSHSPAAFSSTFCRLLILDEYARYPLLVGGEGDALSLARGRVRTYGARGKIYIPSTPVDDDDDEGSFYALYKLGDQREYRVPCPGCGVKYAWSRDTWTTGRTRGKWWGVHACAECGCATEDAQRHELLLAGEWTATAEADASMVTSYHAPGWLAMPGTRSWTEMAEEDALTKKSKLTRKAFVNTTLGLPYQEEIELTPDAEEVARRVRGKYPRGVVPGGAGVLIFSCDVQGDYLDWQVTGWGRELENWAIERAQIPLGKKTAKDAAAEIKKILLRRWPTEDGGTMPVKMGAIDSGYKTGYVYEIVKHFPQPTARKDGRMLFVGGRGVPLIATKGGRMLDPNRIILSAPNLSTKRSRRLFLWIMGTPILKRELYDALSSEEGGEKSQRCIPHVPTRWPAKWITELVAEKRRRRRDKQTGKRVITFYLPQGRDNEALDLWVMSRFCTEAAGIADWTEKDWARAQQHSEPVRPQAATGDDGKAVARERSQTREAWRKRQEARRKSRI